MSNLYQVPLLRPSRLNSTEILSVPSLRKIYDEGGLEGLAMRVPALSKGLLEPERVLKMAQGIKATKALSK